MYCNVEIIDPVLPHGLTVHHVSTQSDENLRRSSPEKVRAEQSLKRNDSNRIWCTVIVAVPLHSVIVHQVSISLDENCRRSYLEMKSCLKNL